MPNNCRVCGLEQDEPPWGSDERTPTYDICACCGVEFGYEDATVGAAKRYRELWLQKGAPWFRPVDRPEGWDLNRQLELVPRDFH
jgi:hypothetical protein